MASFAVHHRMPTCFAKSQPELGCQWAWNSMPETCAAKKCTAPPCFNVKQPAMAMPQLDQCYVNSGIWSTDQPPTLCGAQSWWSRDSSVQCNQAAEPWALWILPDGAAEPWSVWILPDGALDKVWGSGDGPWLLKHVLEQAVSTHWVADPLQAPMQCNQAAEPWSPWPLPDGAPNKVWGSGDGPWLLKPEQDVNSYAGCQKPRCPIGYDNVSYASTGTGSDSDQQAEGGSPTASDSSPMGRPCCPCTNYKDEEPNLQMRMELLSQSCKQIVDKVVKKEQKYRQEAETLREEVESLKESLSEEKKERQRMLEERQHLEQAKRSEEQDRQKAEELLELAQKALQEKREEKAALQSLQLQHSEELRELQSQAIEKEQKYRQEAETFRAEVESLKESLSEEKKGRQRMLEERQHLEQAKRSEEQDRQKAEELLELAQKALQEKREEKAALQSLQLQHSEELRELQSQVATSEQEQEVSRAEYEAEIQRLMEVVEAEELHQQEQAVSPVSSATVPEESPRDKRGSDSESVSVGEEDPNDVKCQSPAMESSPEQEDSPEMPLVFEENKAKAELVKILEVFVKSCQMGIAQPRDLEAMCGAPESQKDLPEAPLAPQEDEAVEMPQDAEPDHEGPSNGPCFRGFPGCVRCACGDEDFTFHETQPEASCCPSTRCRASSTTSPAEDGLQDGKTKFLPSELWPLLLEFLPVTEVVTMRTRAVSSFFSNSKVWVAHLFKLMDLDSLPEHCTGDGRHPGIEFEEYDDNILGKDLEGAEEYKRNASEGFQGYRLWFNGLFQWQKRHPEMSLHFVQMATQWFGSEQIKLAHVAQTLCTSAHLARSRDLTLALANRLLECLHADLRPQARTVALNILKYSQVVYSDLNVDLVFELFETVMSWKEFGARCEARAIAEGIMHVIVMDDETFARAFRHARSLEDADLRGDMDEAAANLQKLMGVLKEHKVRS